MSMVLMLGGFTLKVEKPGLPPTIAPTVTSPTPKSFTLPLSSTAATSNGPAKYVDGCSLTALPEASVATTVSFTCCPTSASLTDGVTCTVLTAAGVLASCAQMLIENSSEGVTRTKRRLAAGRYLIMQQRITYLCTFWWPDFAEGICGRFSR